MSQPMPTSADAQSHHKDHDYKDRDRIAEAACASSGGRARTLRTATSLQVEVAGNQVGWSDSPVPKVGGMMGSRVGDTDSAQAGERVLLAEQVGRAVAMERLLLADWVVRVMGGQTGRTSPKHFGL